MNLQYKKNTKKQAIELLLNKMIYVLEIKTLVCNAGPFVSYKALRMTLL